MATKKKACLVYVKATEHNLEAVRFALLEAGYSICEVKAELKDAIAAKESQFEQVPKELKDCITESELCIFLLPEDEAEDGYLGGSASFAHKSEKRIIGVVAGARTVFPQPFEDAADSMIRAGSKRLSDVIAGKEIWENPDSSPVADRNIPRIKCQ
jgi:hypothetical protein